MSIHASRSRRAPSAPGQKRRASYELSAFLDWLFRQEPHNKTLALMTAFAALAGSRRFEFLDLQMPQIDMEAKVIRLMRAKQYLGTTKAETIQMGPAMENLAKRLIGMPRPENSLHVFNNTKVNPLTEVRFLTGWQKAMVAADNRRHCHKLTHARRRPPLASRRHLRSI